MLESNLIMTHGRPRAHQIQFTFELLVTDDRETELHTGAYVIVEGKWQYYAAGCPQPPVIRSVFHGLFLRPVPYSAFVLQGAI